MNITKACEGCGRSFTSRVVSGQRFCGGQCHANTRRRRPTPEQAAADHARFMAKVSPEPMSGCWLWTGPVSAGYGYFSLSAKKIRTNRYSYEIHKGAIPAGLIVCHKCDQPTCVNPDHLFVGTYKDNTQDCVAKGRLNTAVGERAGRAKQTDVEITAAVTRIRAGVPAPVVAAELGVHKNSVYRWLRGERRASRP